MRDGGVWRHMGAYGCVTDAYERIRMHVDAYGCIRIQMDADRRPQKRILHGESNYSISNQYNWPLMEYMILKSSETCYKVGPFMYWIADTLYNIYCIKC